MTPEAAVGAFLDDFFGEGNELSPTSLARDLPELAAWLEQRLARLRQEPQAAHVLPRRVGGDTLWYGLAHSTRQLEELRQALRAFLVPAYARLARDATLGLDDPVNAAVVRFTSGHYLVLQVIAGQQQQVRRALDIFDVLQAQRPRRQLALSRPLGRNLRDFEMAVLAGAADASEALLRELEATGQLAAQNAVFLRIRRLAGLRLFDELLQLPELATILAIRRPVRVSACLLEAVYVTELARYEADDDPAGALRHFTDVVLRKYPSLFKSRHGLQTPEAIKAFMLHTVAVHPQDAESRAHLLASPDLTPADVRYLEALAELPGAPERPEPTLADAGTSARAGNYDGALQIALKQPASVERAELLIRCAFEIDSIDAMTATAAAVNDLNAEQREAILSSKWFAVLWGHISETLSGEAGAAIEVPTSWTQWFQRVVEGPPILNAIQIAERAVVEWSAANFSAEDGHTVAQLLNRDMTPQTLRLVKEALPHFLQFIDRSDEPARYRELLDDIAVLLLSEEELGVGDVQVVANLIETLLEAGQSADDYRRLVGDLGDLWRRIDSSAHLDAAIDILDVLLAQACPDAGIRGAFFQELVGSFQRWRRRIRPDQWALLADLASELGASDAIKAIRPTESKVDDAAYGPSRDLFAGKMIAIYTLTETAAARAADFLSRNFDDVLVEVSNDHVATDRLRALARAADVFVVATRSAKHAATTFIESQRPAGRPIVYAAGKGSASLLRALLSGVPS